MAFGRFERLVAWRYLRPTKGEGFISVIAGFALVGIALGVGTLIVVLAVMNGFRAELLGRVLGVNGHATVVSGPAGIPDFDGLVGKLAGCPGPGRRHALCRGPGDGQRQRRGLRRPGARRAAGRPAGARGDREPRHRRARWRRWQRPATAAIGSRMAQRMGLRPRQPDHPDLAQGGRHGTRQRAAHQDLHRRRGVRGRDVRVRQQLRLHPARRTRRPISSCRTG